MDRTLEDNQFELRVIRESDSLQAGSIRRGVLESGQLNAVTEVTLEQDLYDVHFGRSWVTRDNPYLTGPVRDRLDAAGLIPPGSIVSEGDVLASMVSPSGQPSDGRVRIHDGSWTVPAGWNNAEVVSIERESTKGRRKEFPRGVAERLRAHLRRVVPFFLGDAVAIGDNVVVTRSHIDDGALSKDQSSDSADLVIPHEVAEILQLPAGEVRSIPVKRVSPAAVDVLSARTVGPYSLITVMPLSINCSKSQSVKVTDKHVAWLAERGLLGLVAELVSLKSDDLHNRPTLKAIALGEADATKLRPAAPETAFEMQQYLWGLGLAVETRETPDGVAVSLKPASDAEVLARSSGVIKRPETIHYRTYAPERGGLFCEHVFGSERQVRRRKSGHLELAEPIIPIIWRLGSNPLLARVLEMEPAKVEKLVMGTAVVYEQNGNRKLRKADKPDEKLLADGWTNLGTGTQAVKALLERTSPERIPEAFGKDGERFFLQTVPIIPADLRPLVLLDSGNFATADCNDLYRMLVNRSNRLDKLKQLNAPQVILDNERRELQTAVDALQANMYVPHPKVLEDTQNRPLVCLFNMIAGRITVEHRKKVEWVGLACAIGDSRVESKHVGVPKFVFDELKLQNNEPVVLTTPEGSFLARLPYSIEQPVAHLNPADAAELVETERVVTIHRPLTEAARHDAQQLLSGNVAVRTLQPDDWCRHSDTTELLDDLIDAATTGRTVTMTSARGLALFGTGPVTSEIRDKRERPLAHWADVPGKEPPKPLPSLDEMAAIIEELRKPCCLMHMEVAETAPDPSQGRLGGLPWVPAGTVWPCDAGGEPLRFIGQFPLESARKAGLLPFDVPPDSLLTVFTREYWENSASAQEGSLIIHGGDNLVELSPPPDSNVHTISVCNIRCEIRDVYPPAEEALDIVSWELGLGDREQLRKYHEEYEQRFPNPADVSRIGGYPNWIQHPHSIKFVAQICSDGVSDVNFSDAGSLYIHGDSPENLSAFIQSY